MADALYGADGFYRGPEGPVGHFRTAAHAGPAFAGPVRRLANEVDEALGRPPRFDLVDLGAGRGELLTTLAAAPLPDHWRLTGVEVASRPSDLPDSVRWTGELPPHITGLVVANEWLDTIPLDVAVTTTTGPRLVWVDAHGGETVGPPPSARQLTWMDRWWPAGRPGDRVEIGLCRDDAWRGVIKALDRGVAVAADYAHTKSARPEAGTLTGYRRGQVVTITPDGRCDITAHVALDSCAAAGCAAGAIDSAVVTQRDALRRLGVSARRTPRAAGEGPLDYLAALARTATAADLIDPDGFGGFQWLVQTKGMALPRSLQIRAWSIRDQ